MIPNDEAIEKLVLLARNSSLLCLKNISGKDDIVIFEVETAPLVFAHWMSLVLVTGSGLRILFKAHYQTAIAKIFAAGVYGVPPEKVSQEQALDFFKEFCNLTAGRLKLLLDANQIRVGVSLPIMARGFDEIFYPVSSGTKTYSWSLRSVGATAFCSVHIDSHTPLKIDILTIDSDDQSGEVEFL